VDRSEQLPRRQRPRRRKYELPSTIDHKETKLRHWDLVIGFLVFSAISVSPWLETRRRDRGGGEPREDSAEDGRHQGHGDRAAAHGGEWLFHRRLLANGKPIEGGHELLPGCIPSGGWANQSRNAEKLIFDEYSALSLMA
jgi:hypothetical protein